MTKKGKIWIVFGLATLALLFLTQPLVHAQSPLGSEGFWQNRNISSQWGQSLFNGRNFFGRIPSGSAPDELPTVDLAASNNPASITQVWNIESLFTQESTLDPTTLTRYVDPLPIPGIMRPKGIQRLSPYYEVTMTEFGQKLHRDLPPTTVWGYNGTYPGATFEVLKDKPIWVKWINNLPSRHLLPIDHTIHGAEPPTPDVRTVVHLHGGNVPPQSDGFPEDWFIPGASATYYYPNRQQATTLWYHDHALGITRLNVYAGLAGFYLIRDPFEKCLRLPRGKYEIPLVIQDRSFNEDGSLFYPDQGVTPVHPVWVPEFFGNTILVNGKVWPYLEVEPRRYRFRILNGSNARAYSMKLSSGQPFYQIGTDGGFLPAPVQVTEILLAPAERADVIIDFSDHKNEQIILTNSARSPLPGGDLPDPATTGQIMQFRVTLPLSGRDMSIIPARLHPFRQLYEQQARVVRDLTLNEILDPNNGNPQILLLNNLHWDDPITEKPKLGTVEVWRYINLTEDGHPMHLHLVQVQILDRQPFNVDTYKSTGQIVFTGSALPPAPNEAGWKDTVRANPAMITRIIMRFGDFTGKYVWHCHILEHEDNEMMRPYEVVP